MRLLLILLLIPQIVFAAQDCVTEAELINVLTKIAKRHEDHKQPILNGSGTALVIWQGNVVRYADRIKAEQEEDAQIAALAEKHKAKGVCKK